MDNTGSSRSRSRSQPRQSDNGPLHRIPPSSFTDDHSVYHHGDRQGTHIDADATSFHTTVTERRILESSSGSSSDDDVDEKLEAEEEKYKAAHGQKTTYEEKRGGVPYEHDVEAQPPALEKKGMSISIKDANLVTWDSDDDPYNPKNCKSSSQAAVTNH
jgi:hypothetical protein